MECRQFAVKLGRSGPQERSQRKTRSVLVELGRWAPHDQETARAGDTFGSCHQTNPLTTLKVLSEPGIASRMLGSTFQVGKL